MSRLVGRTGAEREQWIAGKRSRPRGACQGCPAVGKSPCTVDSLVGVLVQIGGLLAFQHQSHRVYLMVYRPAAG